MSFKNKILLVTGGTGSFGETVINHFLESDFEEIRIFSRDEKKQDDIRKKYNSKKLRFYIGDVRDRSSVEFAVSGSDYIFHAAALKQVPSCEFFPMEAVKTNVLGTENVLRSAIRHKVSKVVVLSTDKAVYPVNAMGISKAMMEKVAISLAHESKFTSICVTRYGNVMGSRGSVIPLFKKQIEENKPMTITDPNMTRFMMDLNEAVDLVMFAFKNTKSGEIFVQKSPAASLQVLSDAVCNYLGKPNHPKSIIGTRHGEKLYEVLLSREEIVRSIDKGDYFVVMPDLRDLNYEKFISNGFRDIDSAEDYNSHNTSRLNLDDTITKLKNMSADFTD